ncbi:MULTISPECIES: hypothetical protein [unclassified Microbacterium]|uniref:hypothetical protein n=1 Tax=unclassified Microbacterium TaxID=2609290 RepID=UPI000EA9112C|nr:MULTISPECIES: hypothetical protein [unclassified Microbacterium]MBT2486400.1 hypothetical protein [Microbacterium sp. ISL-108]RKN69103.1 hypothetical protein D7252_17005 [Microbacterium sp. CGR2]
MNPTDWLFIPLCVLTLVTLLFLFVLGATVVFPRKWDVTLRDAALAEVERRFVGLGLRPQSDLIAADRMVGNGDKPADNNDDTASAVLDAVLVLTNRSDRSLLDAELDGLRSRLECSAIEQQVRMVARVRSIRVARYLWATSAWFNTARFALVGFLWFFPRVLPFLGRRLQKHGGALGIIGVVVGLLWAAVARATAPEGSAFDWFSVVSNVGLICAIAGMVIAVLGLYKAVLVTRFGAPRQWTRRGVITGSVFVLYICVILGLTWSGVITDWQWHLVRWGQTLEVTDDVGRWIGGLVLALAVAYGLTNAYRWVRAPGMTLSNRLWILAGSPILLVMLVLMVPFVLDTPFANVSWVLVVAGWVIVLLGMIASIAGCVEWMRKYRLLKQLGLLPPRRGFRWWALLTWVTAGIIFNSGLTLLLASNQHTADSALFSAALSILNLLTGLWTLAVIPGMVVTALYVRRINKAYEALRFQLAPPHPNLGTREGD